MGKARGKQENPEKKTWHTCSQSLACLTCALCGAQTHTRHRMNKCVNEISANLNHLAAGAVQNDIVENIKLV